MKNVSLPTQFKTQSATLRYLRMAPRKVRLLTSIVRGLSVNEAEAQLMHERRRAARPILKLLRSAVADARTTKQLSPGSLVVEDIRVDKGPMIKRFLPRARGTATPIHKVMSHVTIVLREETKGRQPRFTIVVPKKSKTAAVEKSKAKKRKEMAVESTPERPQKRPGFWKRFFRRKAV